MVGREAIDILTKGGAKVNAESPPDRNTVLANVAITGATKVTCGLHAQNAN